MNWKVIFVVSGITNIIGLLGIIRYILEGKFLPIKCNASIAQLDRASDFGSEGCGFDSCLGHEERWPSGLRQV